MISSRQAAVYTRFSCLSVTACGAAGDGKTDDTAAFRAAVDRAREQGVPVFVPGGTYLLKDTLALEGVSLCGDPAGSWPADSMTQPLLCFTNPDVPGLTVSRAAVSGLCFRAPGTPDAAPSVLITGDEVKLCALKLHHAACGVATAHKGLRGLCLTDLFLPDPLKDGLRIDGCIGTTHIRNVELWPSTIRPTPFSLEGVGIRLTDNEDVELSDCFVWNARRAVVADGQNGRLHLRNCSVDFCADGLVLEGACDVRVEGGTFWTHYTGVRMDHDGAGLRLCGMDLKSNGAPTIEVRRAARLDCEGLIVRRVMDEREVPVMDIAGGRDIRITGCSLSARCRQEPAVRIGHPKALCIRDCVISHPAGLAFSPDADAAYTMKNNAVTVLPPVPGT